MMVSWKMQVADRIPVDDLREAICSDLNARLSDGGIHHLAAEPQGEASVVIRIYENSWSKEVFRLDFLHGFTRAMASNARGYAVLVESCCDVGEEAAFSDMLDSLVRAASNVHRVSMSESLLRSWLRNRFE